jgi:hypothetical protein
MVSDLERLAFLGIDPAHLESAPDDPRAPGWRERVAYGEPTRRPCCSCRALAVATRVVDIPGLGRRWLDQCRDCMIAGIRLNWKAGRPMEGRYRVTVTIDGAPVVQGWWADKSTAADKYTRWIGQHGGRAGARVTLTDEETGETLTEWPTEA